MIIRDNAVEIFKPERQGKERPYSKLRTQILSNNIWKLIVSIVVLQVVVFCDHIYRM